MKLSAIGRCQRRRDSIAIGSDDHVVDDAADEAGEQPDHRAVGDGDRLPVVLLLHPGGEHAAEDHPQQQQFPG